MEPITLAMAREMVQKEVTANTTNLFNREMNTAELYERLEKGGFSRAEITVIIASLRIAGARFKKE